MFKHLLSNLPASSFILLYHDTLFSDLAFGSTNEKIGQLRNALAKE